MDQSVFIMGAGQMGFVMAAAAVEAGAGRVVVWGPSRESMDELRSTRVSPRLPGWTIPDGVELTHDESVAGECTLLVNAVPTQHVREAWQRFASVNGSGDPDVPVVSTAKGLEIGSGLLPTVVIHEVLPDASLVVLSGPTIASELVRRQPAVVIAASGCPGLPTRVRKAFGTDWFRIYESEDLLGVELAGALKNVIALAAGVCDGLGLGFNAKSALLARGLSEMTRLGVAMGADQATFQGIAGVGDLATTCFSPDGRNRACGEAIARGCDLAEYVESQQCVVEGVPTLRSVLERSQTLDVDLPIMNAVGRVFLEGADPRSAIHDLMTRPSGHE